jgi:outer membrane receptor protein involved in Fe transport
MKHIFKIIIVLVLLSQLNYSQNSIIFGTITGDGLLEKVNISIDKNAVFTISDKNGQYTIRNLDIGSYDLVFTHIGYKKKIVPMEIGTDQEYEINIQMEKKMIQLGEAQVVSSRTEQIVKDISLPLEYVSKTKLNNTTHLTLSDLLNKETGLSVVKDGPWATAINVRGLSKQNIVYLIDGNRIETSTNIAAGLSLMDMNDLESIEIVKGGLSSLYGTGATGGVINIISKEAKFNDYAYISSQFISGFNSVNNGYSNYLNVKAGDNKWSAKINGSFRKADDTQIPSGTLENSSFQDESLNASLKYAPIDNMQLNFDYQKFSAYDVGIPGGAPFPASATAKYKYANRELFSGSLQLSNISNKLLKASIKYYNQVIRRSVEIKPNAMVTANPKADHTTNGISFQSDWYLSNQNYLIAGIDVWEREYEGIRKVTNLAKNVISVDKPIPNSKFRSFGVFVKDDISLLSNSLNISLCGRYDFINITNEETKNPVYIINAGIRNDNVRNDLASFEAYDETNKSVSGGIGAVYKLTSEYDITLNLGYNFRSPSLEERYQYIDLGGIVYLGNPELKPEQGLFFDLGFRIWKDDLNIRFNTFLNSFSNLVIDDVLIEDSIYVKNNVGDARLYGFDGRIDYNIYEDFLLYSSVAYVRGEDLTQNKDLPQISPLNGTLGFIVPIKNILQMDFSTTLASNQNKIGIGENRTGGFVYFDISLASETINFSFLNLKLVAGVQNLFNRSYREHLSTYRGINMIEPGRNIFAKFIIDFE